MSGHRLAALAERAERDVLTVTAWAPDGIDAEASEARVRFRGRRLGVRGYRHKTDEFVREETLGDLPSVRGPISLTTTVPVAPGEWQVDAELVVERGHNHLRIALEQDWRWHHHHLVPEPHATVWTGPWYRMRRPGIVRGAWAMLVALGMAAAVALQALLAARRDLPVGDALLVSSAAVMAGTIGARVWYRLQRRPGESPGGWCIQGFVAAAIAAVAVLAPAVGLPIAEYADVLMPGLFAGMAIGRLGCFFAGCCVGRPTASRFGVWSSDRRLGVRRIPVQLLESAWAATVAVVGLALVLARADGPHGFAFAAALAGYTAGRQGLLRLRADARRANRHVGITAAAASVAAVAAALVVALV